MHMCLRATYSYVWSHIDSYPNFHNRLGSVSAFGSLTFGSVLSTKNRNNINLWSLCLLHRQLLGMGHPNSHSFFDCDISLLYL
ncbi:hypothetical protein AQUCO_02800236v1 [Aquilegia coerulea]|uniref:Uncharacterized protein n=1 Tax=Aquilegia coerulea TaxID=218851 RepID=A0A2G5D4H3_AQUCA|nr:hypothetical protein AQUCO_02800236v1 [Aquilegia coerulea]